MTLPIRDESEFGPACHRMLVEFSARFPDDEFHSAAFSSLRRFLARREHRGGAPGGWAGGLVYAIARHRADVSHPVFLNSELEDVFGVSMSTIRKRAG